MELVEGQALSSRLAECPLSIDQVLRYGQKMADALAHAHARGVVHRDFKSANVVVTPEGQIKVLDFGLAKRLKDEPLADATTVSKQSLTAPGTVPRRRTTQLEGMHGIQPRVDYRIGSAVVHALLLLRAQTRRRSVRGVQLGISQADRWLVCGRRS